MHPKNNNGASLEEQTYLYEVLAIHGGARGVIYGTYDHETELPRALKTIQ